MTHHVLPRDNDRTGWGHGGIGSGSHPYVYLILHDRKNWDGLFDPNTKPDIYNNEGDADKDKKPDDDIKVVVGDKDNKSFDFENYYLTLKTHLLGQNIIYGPNLTNDVFLCIDLLSMTQQGLTILADQQTETTPTNISDNQKFVCPVGSLVFTFKLQKVASTLVDDLQKLLALALLDSLNTEQTMEKFITIRIKFSKDNVSQDLYANKERFGGILVQSKKFDDSYDVCLGVGLNLNTSDDVDCLKKIVGSPISRETTMATFFNKFESMYFTFIHQGFSSLQHRLDCFTINDD